MRWRGRLERNGAGRYVPCGPGVSQPRAPQERPERNGASTRHPNPVIPSQSDYLRPIVNVQSPPGKSRRTVERCSVGELQATCAMTTVHKFDAPTYMHLRTCGASADRKMMPEVSCVLIVPVGVRTRLKGAWEGGGAIPSPRITAPTIRPVRSRARPRTRQPAAHMMTLACPIIGSSGQRFGTRRTCAMVEPSWRGTRQIDQVGIRKTVKGRAKPPSTLSR
jgi:hypothetical protein